MADLQKKKLAELQLSVRLQQNGEKSDHEFYHLVDPEAMSPANKQLTGKDLSERLKQISLTPTFAISRMFFDFSYLEPSILSGFTYANLIVEAHIPYCLHIPNGYEMEVDLPERKIKALVTFYKVWTKRAQEDGTNSDDTDFYMESGTTHFQKSTILSPVLPVRPEDGWVQHFTGRNVERMKDQSGTFRYTRLFIEFDPHMSDERITELKSKNEAADKAVFDEISDHALAIINRAIDCYRFVSRQEYIERLGALSINTIYFKKQNHGFHVMNPVPGIEAAVMNRSKKEIDELERLLKNAIPVPLHDLLVLDAHSAFQRKAFTLAIVESFQALEIMLENYLIAAFEDKGIPKHEYEAKLNINWKTKDRLNTVLKEIKSHALKENLPLWDPWHTKYDKVRNEVIHQGKQASAKETEDTLKANEAVMAWLGGLN